MYLLSRAYLQLLVGLYRSMTPGSRLTAGMLGAVVLLSAGYLVMHQGSSPEVDLMHGVPIAVGQLPLMEAAFAKANLRVTRSEARRFSCRVVSKRRTWRPWPTPRPCHQTSATPCAGHQRRQPFREQPREQRVKIAMQDTLSLIIRSMDRIETAYVFYDVGSKQGFNQEKLITAAASVKPAGSDRLTEEQVSSVRYLVVGAIAGLKPENVTVCDLNGRTWHGIPKGMPASRAIAISP